jgi:hypothetical protein
MGDYLLMHDEEGRSYFRRVVYVNAAVYIGSAIIFIIYSVNMIILFSIAATVTIVFLGYALWFIHTHPPTEPEEMQIEE